MAATFQFDSPAAALDAVLARVEPVGTERVDLNQAGGRVLAEDVRTDRPSPSCDVSAMDGYAVRVAELGGCSLQVAGVVAIGTAPPAMPEGAALKIVTGAPIPDGADAVIKREDVAEAAEAIRFSPEVAGAITPGLHIRREGENAPAGALVCEGGRVISPGLAGALATFGVAAPAVFRKVRVGVVVTGDEVVDPRETPDRWTLRDSHVAVLGAMLDGLACVERGPISRVRDDAEAIERAARAALETCDALVLTGGVSMGDYDHVPGVVERLGAELIFHKVPQRPGKPALGAIAPSGKPVFGLPGNPLSVLVTAHRLVKPALQRRAGVQELPKPAHVRLTNADTKSIPLWWQRLVRLTGDGEAELIVSKGSGDIGSAATSDGFVEISPDASGSGPWPMYRW